MMPRILRGCTSLLRESVRFVRAVFSSRVCLRAPFIASIVRPQITSARAASMDLCTSSEESSPPSRGRDRERGRLRFAHPPLSPAPYPGTATQGRNPPPPPPPPRGRGGGGEDPPLPR